MKKAIMLAGFAALLASPVLAQAPSGSYGSGNIIFPGDPAAAAAAGAYGTTTPGVLPAAPMPTSRRRRAAATARGDFSRMTSAAAPIWAMTDAGTFAADRPFEPCWPCVDRSQRCNCPCE